MNLGSERKWTTLIFNPFVYVAGTKALGFGLVAILAAALIGAIGCTHYDGVLDTHVGAPAPLSLYLAEGVIDWLCLALVLLIFGKLVSKTDFRVIDLLGTQALARWPTVFTSLVTLPPAVGRFSRELVDQISTSGGKLEILATPDAVIFFAVTIIMLPLLIWMVVLMYMSYSVSCNVKGGKAIGTFIAGVLIAEILSKIGLYALLKLA